MQQTDVTGPTFDQANEYLTECRHRLNVAMLAREEAILQVDRAWEELRKANLSLLGAIHRDEQVRLNEQRRGRA